ncbi:MAG: bacterial transcriptional activator domain-containing protein [Candidatus Eremiobacteraeota bacterium]|nr:bacterial transcriptional activator domain-containing protein [Candidatus Eremiobacteraeota bacterium]
MTITAEAQPRAGQASPLTVARFLGRVEVRCDGTRVDARLPAPALLVLVRLLLHHGETLRRAQLAFSLWPDVSESDAKAMLRRNLYTIQQSLPRRATPWMECDAKTVTWGAGQGDTWVDATEFQRLSESQNTLVQAARLYEGDFAPAIDHEWAAGERDRLRKSSKRTLENLVERYNAEHDVRNALQYSERLLELDPWREDALCHTMLLRYRLGDRAGAMYSYRTFCGRLHAEFGVDPMPQTERYYSAISSGESLSAWN